MAAIKEKRCYTVQEIQEILNVSRPSVYNLLKKGEFHSVFVAGRHLISKASFDAWLNGYEVEPEGNVSAEGDKNDNSEHCKSYKMQNVQSRVKSVVSGSNMTNAGAKQETVKFQEMQERFLQNWMKAYLLINQAGTIE